MMRTKKEEEELRLFYTYHILFRVYAPEKTTGRYHHRNSEIHIIL